MLVAHALDEDDRARCYDGSHSSRNGTGFRSATSAAYARAVSLVFFDAGAVLQRELVDRVRTPAVGVLVTARADGEDHAGIVAGPDDDVVRARRAVDDVPLP